MASAQSLTKFLVPGNLRLFQNANIPSKDKDLPHEVNSEECAIKSKGIEAPSVELKNISGNITNKRVYGKICLLYIS